MFLFLGSMTTATLWNRHVSLLLSLVLGLLVTIVGIVSIVWGLVVALKVKKLKDTIKQKPPTQPMDRDTFMNFCKQACPSANFQADDWEHVFLALSTDPGKNMISDQDFDAFTKDDFPTMV